MVYNDVSILSKSSYFKYFWSFVFMLLLNIFLSFAYLCRIRQVRRRYRQTVNSVLKSLLILRIQHIYIDSETRTSESMWLL